MCIYQDLASRVSDRGMRRSLPRPKMTTKCDRYNTESKTRREAALAEPRMAAAPPALP